MELSTDITYLKGIGPQRAQLLQKELGIATVGDLLEHFPTSFLDRSQVYKIADLRGAEMPMIQIRGRFIAASMQGEGAKTRLVTMFTDGTGVIEVVWFRNAASIRKSLNPDITYVLFGKPTSFNNHWQLVHPELDTEASAEKRIGLRGVYPLTEGLRNRGVTSRRLHEWMLTALDSKINIPETLPAEIVRANGLISRADALRAIHRHENMVEAERARHRLKFEELFYLQLNIIRYGRNRKSALKGHVFSKIGHFFNTFYAQFLPFELTGAQKRVIREIRSDMNTGRQMNRLL
ncbi:MAG: ATP-dependent DNA helicase RecG, partial [Muribaculaceae bacterium]|nr:ATP-dependent DNA helicase RecG [Muribaculaceae bacterium]